MTLELFDREVPALPADDFVITVTHTADAIGEPHTVTQKITVSAPQFTLDPAEITQCSPPASATGPFGDVLASVLLTEPALPWERPMPAAGCPWLALLVFGDGELIGGDPATHTHTASVAEFLGIRDAVVPPISPKSDVETGRPCRYIRMPTGVFTAVTPRADELPWLAHVRRTTADGEVAVVFANRFPAEPAAGATEPATAVAHLVSVEGLTPWLAETPAFGHPEIVLLSLASWTFGVVPDPAESFAGLAVSLRDAEYDPATDTHHPGNLALRLPPPPGTTEATARITAGYVPVAYHARSGEDTMGWYRGPITPQPVAVADPAPPLPTVDAALIYDAEYGVFDFSLASAWQAGRTAALADRTFGQALYAYRQAVQRRGDTLADRLTRPHFADVPQASLASDRLTGSTRDLLAAVLRGEASEPVSQPAFADLATALAAAPVQQALTELVAPELEPVADWLAGLALLEPLPFTCLVPDERLLPRVTPAAGGPTTLPGSMRFGYLDPNWVTAAIAGAMSLAVESSRHAQEAGVVSTELRTAIDAAIARRCHLTAPPAGPVGVLLLRSDLVSGWPTLAVTPLDAAGEPTPVLRTERLAPGVLLVLFDGVPAAVRLAEPHAALTLGVDQDGNAELRRLAKPVGAALGPFPIRTGSCVRDGGRVLAITPKGALVDTLTKKLDAKPGTFGPAAFALQLLRSPQALSVQSAAGGAPS